MINHPIAQRIDEIGRYFEQEMIQVASIDSLEKVRVAFLGRTSYITELMGKLKELSVEEKKLYGPLCNQLKQHVTAVLEQKLTELQQQSIAHRLEQVKEFDVTAYKPHGPEGHLHPITHIMSRIQTILMSMGFTQVDGPEVEQEQLNFDALNIPADHPARSMQDTFWLPMPHTLLRTHTSPVQVRAMRSMKPPMAIFTPGRVFRREATDATHDFLFYQCECLMIDRGISLANAIGVMKVFVQQLFNHDDITIRLRPSYFPFVEPGFEVDMSCVFCTDQTRKQCSVCKTTGWVEIAGAGLVHPHVLREGNINPDEYSGFAFGFSLDRPAMLLYGINDIRLLRCGTIEFLQQF
jgi:phenylalanyl-tRNA synthetase alpha chain